MQANIEIADRFNNNSNPYLDSVKKPARNGQDNRQSVFTPL